MAPLFSLHSAESIGIGELPDLRLLADWCRSVGMSVVQLLPMNDVGFDFQPYSAQSCFALDPLYLSLRNLVGVPARTFQQDIEGLRQRFPAGRPRVDYGIKAAKLDLLWAMFRGRNRRGISRFDRYLAENGYWLPDYALFKVLKERFDQRNWEAWDEPFRRRDPGALETVQKEQAERVLFHQWLQWQLFEQFKSVKDEAEERGVFLMGDLPFLVSRDSVDVWAHQDYFKLDLSSGAPPDLYFSAGQRWGMPPYHWDNIARNGYDYLREKLRYAENFYDMFRVDHVIGVFRLFTIPLSEPEESAGLKGAYDPPDEGRWEEHGRNLLTLMLKETPMLPCGEDLGTVPPCSYKVLEELSLPGIDVQRWSRDWDKTNDFTPPGQYRKNAVAIVSTHDMSTFSAWWKYECGTVDEMLVRRKCEDRGIPYEEVKPRLFDLDKSRHGRLRWRGDVRDAGALAAILGRRYEEVGDFIGFHRSTCDEREKFWRYLGMEGSPPEEATPQLVQRALETAGRTVSIFSIQLLQDWFSLGHILKTDPWDCRVNFPGIMGDRNWTFVSPVSLEEMQRLPINGTIKDINARSGRA